MEDRMMKFYSKESNMLALHAERSRGRSRVLSGDS